MAWLLEVFLRLSIHATALIPAIAQDQRCFLGIQEHPCHGWVSLSPRDNGKAHKHAVIVDHGMQLEPVEEAGSAVSTVSAAATRRSGHAPWPFVSRSNAVHERFAVDDIDGIVTEVGRSEREVGIDPFEIQLDAEIPGAIGSGGKEEGVGGAYLSEPLVEEFTDECDGHELGVTGLLG